eukprot:6090264-Amphidinium_carterae.1
MDFVPSLRMCQADTSAVAQLVMRQLINKGHLQVVSNSVLRSNACINKEDKQNCKVILER